MLIFGWQQWRSHRARHDLEAATQYEVLSTIPRMTKAYDAVKQIAAKLKTDYPDTPYAVMAAMLEADLSAERADLETAHSSLDWAYQHAGNDALKALAGTCGWRASKSRNQGAGCAGPDRQASGVGLHGADRRIARRRARRSRPQRRARVYGGAGQSRSNSPNRAFVEMKLNDLGGAEKKGS